MAVISIEIPDHAGRVTNYIIADDRGLLGLGTTAGPLADARMGQIERMPSRFKGGRPTDAEGWVKVALSNTAFKHRVNRDWAEGRTTSDVAAELAETLKAQ
jgi:hypothetical protein